MKRPGEPFETIRQLVKLAEGQFEERHALNLNVAAMKKPLSPELSGWMLTHAPSTKRSWKEHQASLIAAEGATFNLGLILDQVAERRRLRAAQSVSPDPTTVIDHDPHPE